MEPLDLEETKEHPPKLGRKRDHTRDPEILQAALDVLAETGYDGMTVDLVAARARAGKATLYRRWPSKAELVVDAVACMKSKDLDLNALPDTGTLRGDLVAMIKTPTMAEAERKLHVMAGLVSMIARAPEMQEAVHAAIVEPRAQANRVLIRRAIERGEVAPDIDIEMVSMVAPAMAAYRVLVIRKPVTREFLLSVIDGVVLPAATGTPAALAAHA
ncbi:AcrR family transcriptional regulator [Microbacterium halimionae]|uniref:AcrR family transcriptional regulator n=1 Tax=Microbacterium halimionae TaxID=1526413 RepID=A0A7W3JPF9_9MICO|nr:TetR/AcrR family transcriptional regulator [Microbacterium halimionae]MBA8816541.1 AcrR family transcriptional regulator [Microbacterium halimionae]NII95272.1 AcrR family transcriptional regulator [Microbacterium halimionae]